MNYQNKNRKLYGIDDYTPCDYASFEERIFEGEDNDTCERLKERFLRELEKYLYIIFDEMDAVIFDYLPRSLFIEPIKLIQLEYLQRVGLYLTTDQIIDAYLRYLEVCSYE